MVARRVTQLCVCVCVCVCVFSKTKLTFFFTAEECTPGKYLDLSDNQCKDCMKNFYQNETGQVACIPCPAGKSTEGRGANSSALCHGEPMFCVCP